MARWGIDILKVEKTDKTMAELEVQWDIFYFLGLVVQDGTAVQYRAVHCGTAQYSTVRYGTARHSTVQRNYRAVKFTTAR